MCMKNNFIGYEDIIQDKLHDDRLIHVTSQDVSFTSNEKKSYVKAISIFK